MITGRAIDPDDECSLMAAAKVMINEGVKHVVITLGSKGCFFTDGDSGKILPALPSNIVNGNGAGDALMAGMAAASCRGYGLEDQVRLGMAAAAFTIETPGTNDPLLNFEAAAERANI